MNIDRSTSQMIFAIKRTKLISLLRSEALTVVCFLLALRLVMDHSFLRLLSIGCVMEFTFVLHVCVEVIFHLFNAWERTPVRRPYVLISSKALMTFLTTTCLLPLIMKSQPILRKASHVILRVKLELVFVVLLSGLWTYLWCQWRTLVGLRCLGHGVCLPPLGWNSALRQHLSSVFAVMKKLWLEAFIAAVVVIVVKFLLPKAVPTGGFLIFAIMVTSPALTAFWISGFLRFDSVLNSQYNFGNPKEPHHFKSVVLALRSDDQIAMRFGFAHLRRLAFLEGTRGREDRRQLFTKTSTPTVWENCTSCCCLEIKSMTLIIARVCERLPDFQTSSGGFTTTEAWKISSKIEHKCMILSHCVATLTGLIIAACAEDHQAAARSGEPSLGDSITVIFEGFFYLTAFWKANTIDVAKFPSLRALLDEFEASCLSVWSALRGNMFVQMKNPYHVSEQYLKRAIQSLFQDE